MKNQPILGILAAVLIAAASVTPALGASKEMIQLQTQVQALQDQMSRMQQSFDQQMGVMNHLLEQNTDNMNKVSAAMTQLQTSMAKLQTDNGGKVDQISGQIQALNDSIDELKARMAKLSKQMDDMQASQQNQAANQAAAQAQQQALANAPPPDMLYKNALRDYNAGKTDLATQEFSDYIKYYRSTDLAGNAYFYLAEMQYRAQNYAEAVKNYDQVIQNFPSGNKAASASLKKGFALIELGQTDDGVAELRHLIQRFPKSSEALQARDRLKKLGVPATAGQQGE
ncbi:MAG TPA: tetratricopeptide repeat protein [Terriglobales bacterium]